MKAIVNPWLKQMKVVTQLIYHETCELDSTWISYILYVQFSVFQNIYTFTFSYLV